MVRAEAEGLLCLALADLETARASSDPALFREGAWGFWMQQAVEKALKAWLICLGEVPPLTHDLNRLLLLLRRGGVDIQPLQPLGQLTIFAVQFRYDPNPQPLGLDRQQVQDDVQGLLTIVEGILRENRVSVDPGSESPTE